MKRTRAKKFLRRIQGVYTCSYIQHSSLMQFRTFVKYREMPKCANQHFCQKNVCQKQDFPQQHIHTLLAETKFLAKIKSINTHTEAFQAHPAAAELNSFVACWDKDMHRQQSALWGSLPQGRVPIALSQGWQMVN